ncbi:MAG: tagaturonate reductase [Clostridia bacterium]|nr:tagaturonate reductase [Clostridia bacterium]
MKETILQFGTGNFLRAFAGDFIDRLNRAGLYDGNIVIVSPTDSANVARINAQGGRYHLLLRGVAAGETVDECREIGCVTRAVNPYRDFDAYLSLAESPDLRFIISNTTEAGIAFDETCRLTDRPAASFPAKLTQWLYRRWQKGLPGVVVLACELIDRNADLLKDYVLRYAALWATGPAFAAWLEAENAFCNTLVDRIVTGRPEDAADWELVNGPDALLDAAEPYHFWAIEGDHESELPFRKAGLNVIWTDDISFYKKRKVRVLNGAHTSMVFPALLAGIETVGDCLKDEQLNAFLQACLFRYILPVLGETEENLAFTRAVLERFANPFIRHQLTSIALNSVSKWSVRVLPTLLEYRERFGVVPKPPVLSLAALIRYYRTHEVADAPGNAAYLREHGLPDILANAALWGTDLSALLEPLEEAYHIEDIREAIAWSLR